MIENLIRVTDRQDLFKGDLNMIQRLALQWLMDDEQRELAELETIRTKNFALAANPVTSGEFLKVLFEEKEDPEEEWIEADLDNLEEFIGKFG